MIVGGYGAVGSNIASRLAPRFGNRLIIAGRNPGRAAALAESLGQGVRSRVVDITQAADDTALEDVGCVVMCLDMPEDSSFVRSCFERGIHYVDVSAEYSVL